MPGRKRRLVLAPDAQQELLEILRHTTERWGTPQRDGYRSALYRSMRTLCDYPYLGRSRNDLKEGIYSHPSREHIIYYRVGSNDITILRIMHKAMDPFAAFQEEGLDEGD